MEPTIRKNTMPTMLVEEKTASLKERDRAILRRKGRGRKTKHVVDSYRDRYDNIKWD